MIFATSGFPIKKVMLETPRHFFVEPILGCAHSQQQSPRGLFLGLPWFATVTGRGNNPKAMHLNRLCQDAKSPAVSLH